MCKGVALAVMVLLGCASERMPETRAQRAAIIGAPAAPERHAVVQISHRDGSDACSGALISPRLVATAKHCVFRASVDGDEPLAADGFRVAFGPDEERFELRFGRALRWVGMPDELDVQGAVTAGEDVALIELGQDAPAGTAPLAVRRSYQPSAADELTLVGFGIWELDNALAGVRRSGTARVTGFDPDSGVLQLEGAAACFGDSGGPVLYGPDDELVALLGRVARQGDGGYCESGISFANSIANPRVRALLLGACRDAGGCGPSPLRTDSGAQPEPVSPDAIADAVVPGEVVDASRDAAVTPDAATPHDAPAADDGCSCRLGVPARAPGLGASCPAVILALLLFRRRSSQSMLTTGSGTSTGSGRRPIITS